MSLRMDAKGVTPIPPPTRTATSYRYQSWWPSPYGPSKYSWKWHPWICYRRVWILTKSLNFSDLRPRTVAHGVGVVGLAEVHGPRADGSDVKAEVLLMRSGGQSERMVLIGALDQAGDTAPLTALVVKVQRSLELQVGHICEQNQSPEGGCITCGLFLFLIACESHFKSRAAWFSQEMNSTN